MREKQVRVGEIVTGEVIESWQKASGVASIAGEYLGELDFLGKGYGGIYLLKDEQDKKK